MNDSLSAKDLELLIKRVFQPQQTDRGLAIMIDLPDDNLPDNPDWALRREMALQWGQLLDERKTQLGLDHVSVAWYRNAGSNNADLPESFVYANQVDAPPVADTLAGLPHTPFAELFARHSLVLAPTELSATAPLKVATRNGLFRAATMPGFLPSMIPALKIDYSEVNRRVNLLKKLLDASESARILFSCKGQNHELTLDLRHRTGHASGGIFPTNGVAGNLPSGEAYIVPYEGEIVGDSSHSAGHLPVQIDGEIVVFEIEGNRAVNVLTSGPAADAERKHLEQEPAYANLSELGLGVLGDFGLKPAGSILLDEKLGLHIAFGRSDHFGGTVGPTDFSCPEAVIHLDRVYIPESQPDIKIRESRLIGPGLETVVIENDQYSSIFQA